MKKGVFAGLFFFLSATACCQYNHPFVYCSSANKNLSKAPIRVSIFKEKQLVYREVQLGKADSSGHFCLEIGKGKPEDGKFDSIMWSVGNYFMELAVPAAGKSEYVTLEKFPVRVAENLEADHEEGTETGNGTSGKFSFSNKRGTRPKKIFLDLSTSYVNTAYPADTYPIYRHFEWFDTDQDGLGNSFTVSFSDNTSNAIVRDTQLAGEVSLYTIPFQRLIINSQAQKVDIELTSPVPVQDHGRTYAVKGPWTLIWYLEW